MLRRGIVGQPMAHPAQIRITIRLAWWVRPYLTALLGFAAMTGLEPDAAKVVDLISRRGLRFVRG